VSLIFAPRLGDADALWVLSRGKLGASVSGAGQRPREIPPVTAPGYVGELGLLHGIPRTATVWTLEESTPSPPTAPAF
jgi:hypothetical protein